MELFRQDRELGDIAGALGRDLNTVTKAIRFLHESRSLSVPDGRTRRKSLPPSSETKGDAEPDVGRKDLPAA